MTKREFLKKEYDREYANYLRRVNRKVKLGYIVNVIKRVKSPTHASINRLKSQTGTKIAEKSRIVDIITGEILTGEKKKKKIAKQNKEFLKLSLLEQEIARTGYTGGGQINVYDYEVIIQNWYDSIDDFPQHVQGYLQFKTDQLLKSASKRIRIKFAYTFYKYPNIFPDRGDSDRGVIDMKFESIYGMMESIDNTDEFQRFYNLFDYIETE